MVVIRILFWTWLLISVAVLLYRLVRRLSGRGRRMATSGIGVTPDGVTSTAESPGGGNQPQPPAAESAPVDAPTPEPEARRPDHPTPRRASPTPPDAGRTDPPLPAPVAGLGEDPTIAEMVSGIQLPCDLVPMIGAEARPGTRESVAFVTSGHSAQVVGEALAAEFARLGFRVHPLADDQVLATRGDHELKAAIHGRPGGVTYGGLPAFPMAPTGSVAVELWRA